MKVSIESNESPPFGLGQRYALVVFDSEGEMHEKVDPPPIRVHVDDFEQDRPLARQRSR